MDFSSLVDNSSKYKACNFLHRCYLIPSLKVTDIPRAISVLETQILLCFALRRDLSTSNDCKMTLDTIRSTVPHIYYANTSKCLIAVHFNLRLAICKIFSISHFSIDYNHVHFQNCFSFFFFNFKFSKSKEVTFVCTVTGNMYEKFS